MTVLVGWMVFGLGNEMKRGMEKERERKGKDKGETGEKGKKGNR